MNIASVRRSWMCGRCIGYDNTEHPEALDAVDAW